MRHPLLAVVVPFALLSASSAGAAPSTPTKPSITPLTPLAPLAPLLPADLPAQCRELARTPASAETPPPELAAHLSVANCLAEDEMAHVALAPDDASRLALDAAVRPSLAMFDDVIAHGDAHARFLAEAAKADLYLGLVIRVRSVATTPEVHAKLEPSLTPWLEQAARANREALKVAHRALMQTDRVTRAVAATVIAVPPARDLRLGVYVPDPAVLDQIRAMLTVEDRIAVDRQRREAALVQVEREAKLLSIDQARVKAFRVAWDRAVAGGHAPAAGTLAREHFEALHEEAVTQAAVARARLALARTARVVVRDREALRDTAAPVLAL